MTNDSKSKAGRKKLPKKSKLIQISISQIDFRRLQLLRKKGFIPSYSQIVASVFDQKLQEKWKEFTNAFPDLANTIYNDSKWK